MWRFPYIAGEYGGAAFILLYLIFLVILGLPVMVMEFAVGRASQRSRDGRCGNGRADGGSRSWRRCTRRAGRCPHLNEIAVPL